MADELMSHVVAAEHLGGQRLHLRFDNGREGNLDLRQIGRGFPGRLQALEEPSYVARVAVTDHGTLEWPNGVELDPIVVYCAATGTPLPDFEAEWRREKRRRSAKRRAPKKPTRASRAK